MSEQPNEARSVFAAWNAVMADVRSLAKGDRNKMQGFNFRGIDSVLNAVGPYLRKHGVAVVPYSVAINRETYKTTKGTSMTGCHTLVTFRVHGPDGSHFDGQAPGEASDAGDKSTPKSMSVALRTFLLQALCLPTEDEDPDSHSHEREDEDPDSHSHEREDEDPDSHSHEREDEDPDSHSHERAAPPAQDKPAPEKSPEQNRADFIAQAKRVLIKDIGVKSADDVNVIMDWLGMDMSITTDSIKTEWKHAADLCQAIAGKSAEIEPAKMLAAAKADKQTEQAVDESFPDHAEKALQAQTNEYPGA